jgi:thioredoxin reductase/NAD-dependent dihydropyrimidine dehydrogenase PreA subunit
VPQQIYEVVTATMAVASGEEGGRLHAVVRADLCVGCGTCAAACPEAGALTMRGKVAVVEKALCTGHGKCAEACPVGAIVLTTGAAVHRVEVPELGADFQTNVPGLYVVGELGGRGLIKNAVNEGKLAVEHIAGELPPCEPRLTGDPTTLDVVIVGSGPAGLSAALEAHRSGLKYEVLEQGTLADTVRKYPRHKLLFAEPLTVPLYGDLWVADGSKESLLQIWETIVANTGLHLRTGRRVDQIIRSGDVFRVSAGGYECHARRVVLALGRRGTPRRLGVPGEEQAKVVYDIAEMEDFKGRRVLVIGGGDSAIESALGLANQPGTTVHLSYRGEDFNRAKERNRDKLKAAVAAGKIALLLKSQSREIRPDLVLLDVDGESMILPNDDVIVRIGGDAPYTFLQQLGIRIIQKDVPLAPERAQAG